MNTPLTEKLGAAARIIESDSDALLKRWKMMLLNKSIAAKDILGELIDSGMDEGPGEGHPVHAA
ncbi:MAG: ISKra4 family transposase, partial [Gammaproteobacteria bacterium]|nr:ISKra4 family transposase [Gammaproteobacteria bacterium]